ncbi:formate/nitrite transporter family protein [Streptomyces sp. NPDC058612]|uniref:formate/nitrite transporter family protein n=1 Tax=Streptomyces sp. NPDC058612 TaxID=3346555 RepID=UPI00364DB966
MDSIARNVEATSGQAVHKAHTLGHPPRYFVSAMPAGAYIGIGEVLLLVAVSPFVAQGSAAVKLLEGALFPVALTIVMFAGAQLFTSNVMVMLVGALSGRTGLRALGSSWTLSLAGNLAGAFAFGAMVHASGGLDVPGPGGTPRKSSSCGCRSRSSWPSDSNTASRTWLFSASRSWMAQSVSVIFSGT